MYGKAKATVQIGLSVGAIVGLVGCNEIQAGDDGHYEGAALALTNGLAMINGLALTNGLAGTNGLANTNGLALTNGLAGTNGLAATNGLMTTTMGRRTLAYLVKCALNSSQNLVKQDQNGASYTYPGNLGLAPEWYSGSVSTADQQLVSACMMAHMNAAGVHVPIWLDSGASAIGWGQNGSYPNMEGTFFGNVMLTGSDGKVPAFFCEGSGFTKGVVPGRLGASLANMPYRNPFGDGELCDSHCSKYGSDGYTNCNGYSNPITVWRAASYNPVFDNAYKYKLMSSSANLRMGVVSGAGEGASVQQASDSGGAIQQFYITQVTTSQWKIINVSTGKAVTNRSGSTVTLNAYNGSSTDNWAIDDHNGHFKIVNKSTGLALQSPGSWNGASLNTGTYNGQPNTDWDVYAMDAAY